MRTDYPKTKMVGTTPDEIIGQIAREIDRLANFITEEQPDDVRPYPIGIMKAALAIVYRAIIGARIDELKLFETAIKSWEIRERIELASTIQNATVTRDLDKCLAYIEALELALDMSGAHINEPIANPPPFKLKKEPEERRREIIRQVLTVLAINIKKGHINPNKLKQILGLSDTENNSQPIVPSTFDHSLFEDEPKSSEDKDATKNRITWVREPNLANISTQMKKLKWFERAVGIINSKKT